MTPTLAEQIKAHVPLIAYVAQALGADKVRRAGQQRATACCPFHDDKTPSLTLSDANGLWYCHGCKRGGDVITFASELAGTDFTETCRALSANAGLDLDAIELAAKQRSLYLVKTMIHCLELRLQRPHTPARGLSMATLQTFRVGIGPAAPDAPYDIAQAASSGRLVLPILDRDGACVALAGRMIDDPRPGERKYMLTRGFDKRRHLYGEHLFERGDHVVLVEGQFDVMRLHDLRASSRFGRRPLAVMGSALSTPQIDTLRNNAATVTIMFDGDQAGRRGALTAWRALNAVIPQCVIAHLPPGEDPDHYFSGDVIATAALFDDVLLAATTPTDSLIRAELYRQCADAVAEGDYERETELVTSLAREVGAL
jgi:DNA primase